MSGSRLSALTIAVPFAVACSPSPPAPRAATWNVPAPVPAAPRPTPLVPTDPCRSRPGCEVTARHDAGLSAAGHRMVVADLSLGMRHAEDELPEYGRNCEEREIWLLHEGPEAPPPRALLSLCNDGYGASGRGEDTIEVSENRMTHVQVGGSAWWWSNGTTITLDPPRVIEESHSGGWALSNQHDSTSRFDYRTFQGTAAEAWPACDERGSLPEETDEPEARSSLAIVATALPARLTTGPIEDAAAVDLAACATRAASPGSPDDAVLALVMDEATGTLLARVRDDAIEEGDRLIVWATSEHVRGGLHCWQTQKITPLQIAPGGRIVGGAAASPGATVEAARDARSGSQLFRVRLGAVPQAISVAYRDVDPRGRRRTIATSDVEAHGGERVSLGSVVRVDPKRATCHVTGDALAISPAPLPPPDVAMIDAP